MNARLLSRLSTLILLLLGCAGAWLLAYSTRQGLGLNDDSIAYIAGARSILDGQGYREAWLVSNGPVIHFPPGYPAALALFGLLTDLDPLRGARALNGILFGLNIALTGWLGWRMTGSRLAGILSAMAMLLSSELLRIHARAMSEPLYIFLTLVSFLILDLYFGRTQVNETARKSRGAPSLALLVLLGLTLGWAYLARYAALSLFATMLAGLLILRPTWRDRWQSAALLSLGALPWMIGWSIRNRFVGGSITNRVLSWHPISFENWELGVETLAEFFVPLNMWRNQIRAVPGLFESLFLLIGLVLIAWVLLKSLPRILQPELASTPNVLSLLNGLYIIVYLAALVATMTLFDPATKFQVRILSPVYIPLLLLFSALGVWLWRKKQIAWRIVIVMFTLGMLGMFAYSQSRFVDGLRASGGAFAGEKWLKSEVFTALDQFSPDTLILSNEPGVIYLYTGRPSGVLPREEPGISELKPYVLSGKIVLVLFRVNKSDAVTLAYYYELGRGLFLHDLGDTWMFSAFPDRE